MHMHGRRPQQYRIRRIVELIRSGMARNRPANARTLGQELGVSRRTIANDLDYLRDDLNAPIEYAPHRHGYRLTDPTWELPALQVSRREVFAFAIAARLIRAFKGTPLETDMAAVMRKIERSLEGKVTLDPAVLIDRFAVLGEDYARQDPAIWEQVARGLGAGETLDVTYCKFNGQTGAYLLDPYHLVAYHGNWYLLAFHHRRGKVAAFALSRLRRVRTTGRQFAGTGHFDAEAWLREGFGITGGEPPIKVRLLFSPKVATYIRERIWHPSQETADRRDGGVELRFETTGWKELVRFVLSWQPDVKVLAPRRLKERVHEKMRQALAEPTGDAAC
jgi:proteasome accessory factor B